MEYRTFGKAGWDASEIGFGGWAIGGRRGAQDDGASTRAAHQALDLGVPFIDTAGGVRSGMAASESEEKQ
ncbi:MAG: aldo/keto reductase [Puniceicoccaceae bacterium]